MKSFTDPCLLGPSACRGDFFEGLSSELFPTSEGKVLAARLLRRLGWRPAEGQCSWCPDAYEYLHDLQFRYTGPVPLARSHPGLTRVLRWVLEGLGHFLFCRPRVQGNPFTYHLSCIGSAIRTLELLREQAHSHLWEQGNIVDSYWTCSSEYGYEGKWGQRAIVRGALSGPWPRPEPPSLQLQCLCAIWRACLFRGQIQAQKYTNWLCVRHLQVRPSTDALDSDLLLQRC
ncbi:MC132 [Molluscum contagiosum virus subtype 2]|uniref:MC132 n=2 Tax=Molluscum contagiosum virus TaxID=10279 RepID=A0A3G2VSL7_MCV2|nr:MC132 [Molluscum contagiosum virus subtype 2]AYO89155.1 MC132 [Molluscum contagiosum virus subtype 2]QHW18293.1 MC132L [Molluscum contagiosum virus]QHW18641.1 MC132L [Molluscum contagiosum virus]DBA39897.1 TPA_asm: MC132L [Molluscum contagiosum virus]